MNHVHSFDYQFLKHDMPAELLGISGMISDLKARDMIRRSQNVDMLKKLRKAAMIESIKRQEALTPVI